MDVEGRSDVYENDLTCRVQKLGNVHVQYEGDAPVARAVLCQLFHVRVFPHGCHCGEDREGTHGRSPLSCGPHTFTKS